MWQPIETAPKDQTFLAVLNCAGQQTICTMRWEVAEAKNNRPDHSVFHRERVTHWMPLPALPGAQPAPSFADAYQGAMEEVAIWKRRALEAEDLNRKFVAEINGPAYMGEPAQPAPSVPEGWKLVPIEPTPEMMLVAQKADHDHLEHEEWLEYDGEDVKRVYRAMLAAAPEAKP